MEGTMKYSCSARSAPIGQHAERVAKARETGKTGIRLESVHYTQGPYDFVDVVDAPNAEAMLTFSV
jgi:uncharacterized protein with GYD domain